MGLGGQINEAPTGRRKRPGGALVYVVGSIECISDHACPLHSQNSAGVESVASVATGADQQHHGVTRVRQEFFRHRCHCMRGGLHQFVLVLLAGHQGRLGGADVLDCVESAHDSHDRDPRWSGGCALPTVARSGPEDASWIKPAEA